MSKFHPLKVAHVTRETRDAVALTFDVPAALKDSFRFVQGQHLTLRADIGGEDLRRSYSICSAVQDETLRIAVKKAPGGAFSNWINDHVRPGQVLEVMPPMGHFNVALDPRQRRHYVGFAAGSGITPLLSIIKTTLGTEPHSRFTLFYGNRSSAAVIFKEELSDLKDGYLERLNLVYVMSREPQDIAVLNGRIDQQKADALLTHWVDPAAIDTAFVCGPDGMMQAVSKSLQAHGVPKARIKIELFAASIPRHEHKPQSRACAGPQRMRGHRDHRRRGAPVHAGEDEGQPHRRSAQAGHRAAVLLQGRRVLDLSRQAHQRRGRHGRQLRARGLRDRARLHPVLPELPGDRHGRRRFRSAGIARAEATAAADTC